MSKKPCTSSTSSKRLQHKSWRDDWLTELITSPLVLFSASACASTCMLIHINWPALRRVKSRDGWSGLRHGAVFGAGVWSGEEEGFWCRKMDDDGLDWFSLSLLSVCSLSLWVALRRSASPLHCLLRLRIKDPYTKKYLSLLSPSISSKSGGFLQDPPITAPGLPAPRLATRMQEVSTVVPAIKIPLHTFLPSSSPKIQEYTAAAARQSGLGTSSVRARRPTACLNCCSYPVTSTSSLFPAGL